MIHRTEIKIYDPAPRVYRTDAQRRARWIEIRQLAADILAGRVQVQSASPRQFRRYGRVMPIREGLAFEVRYQRRTHVRYGSRETFSTARAARIVGRRHRAVRPV